MPVIKCSNCENEILDSEIVCPYCDCPISETIKKMKNDDLKSYSSKSISDLTGKIPAISEEPKIATASDFEKEKKAMLDKLAQSTENTKNPKKTSDEKPGKTKLAPEIEEMNKTVKITIDSSAANNEASEKQVQKHSELNNTSGNKTSKITQEEHPLIAKAQQKASATRLAARERAAKRRKIKKITTAVIAVLSAIAIIAIGVAIFSGDNPKNEKPYISQEPESIKGEGFVIEGNSTLVITSDTAMKDYKNETEPEWYKYREKIKYITVNSGVTRIGAYSFANYSNLKSINIAKTVTEIGEKAFYKCTSLENFDKIPEGLRIVKEDAFKDCIKLNLIPGYTEKRYIDKDETLEFTPQLTEIGDDAFMGCTDLKAFKLPPDAVIGIDSFFGCHEDFCLVCEFEGKVSEYAEENDIPIVEDFDKLPEMSESDTKDDSADNDDNEDEDITDSSDNNSSNTTNNTNSNNNNNTNNNNNNNSSSNSNDNNTNTNENNNNTTTNSNNNNSNNNSNSNTNNTTGNNNNTSSNNQSSTEAELQKLYGQLATAPEGSDEAARILEEIDKVSGLQ